jgi:hypothetical protein
MPLRFGAEEKLHQATNFVTRPSIFCQRRGTTVMRRRSSPLHHCTPSIDNAAPCPAAIAAACILLGCLPIETFQQLPVTGRA